MALEDLAADVVPLPGGEVRGVGELGGQGLEARRLLRAAGGEGLDQAAELGDQHAHRPPVRDDVVHDQEQRVVLPVQSEHDHPEQGAAAQVERHRPHDAGQPGREGVAPRLRQGREVDHRHRQPEPRRHHLDRRAGPARLSR